MTGDRPEPEPTCVLAFRAPDVASVHTGDRVDVRVAVQPPTAGVELRFGLVGNARDGSLSATRATTDEGGVAGVTLIAPSSPASFRVRASAPCGNDVHLDIATSDRGFGSIAVEASYQGARQPDALSVALFRARTCADVGGMEPDRVASLPVIGGTVQFSALPAGLDYVVRGAATGTGGVELATACAGPILVVADRVPPSTRMVFADRPLRLGRGYDLALAFDLGAVAERASRQWVAPVRAEVEGAGGDVAYLSRAVAAAVERAGGAAAREAFQRAVGESLGAQLEAVLTGREAHVVDVFARLAGDEAGALAAVRATTSFATTPGEPDATAPLDEAVFLVDPGTPDVRRDDATFAAERRGTVRLSRGPGDTVSVALDALPVPLARLARLAHDAMLVRLGVTASAEYVALTVCPAAPSVFRAASGACGDECILAACQEALGALGARFDAAVTSAEARLGVADLRLAGTARPAPGSLAIERLEGAAAGAFREDPATAVRAIATLSARATGP